MAHLGRGGVGRVCYSTNLTPFAQLSGKSLASPEFETQWRLGKYD